MASHPNARSGSASAQRNPGRSNSNRPAQTFGAPAIFSLDTLKSAASPPSKIRRHRIQNPQPTPSISATLRPW